MREQQALLTRIEKVITSRRNAERRVASYIFEHAHDVCCLPITELARRTETSEATISRLCQTLGYAGYPDFKIALTRDLATPPYIRTIPRGIVAGDSTEVIAQKLSMTLTEAVKSTLHLVKVDLVDRAIDAFVRARMIYFYGIGGSGAVARVAHHLFLKAGISNIAYDDGYMQLVSASLVTRDDLVVGISHSGNTMDVVKALQIAKETMVTTVCITSNPASAIVQHADIALFTASEEEPIYGDFMEAKMGQIAMLNLLYIGVAMRTPERVTQDLERTAKVIWDRSYRPPEEDGGYVSK